MANIAYLDEEDRKLLSETKQKLDEATKLIRSRRRIRRFAWLPSDREKQSTSKFHVCVSTRIVFLAVRIGSLDGHGVFFV
jgi:hypothetical protein